MTTPNEQAGTGELAHLQADRSPVSVVPRTKSVAWIWIGDIERGDEFNGDDNGKYLFFDADQEKLCKIAETEISGGDYILAKVATEARNGEYVLCLYWYDDSHKHSLADKYRGVVKYRYWKNNAATRADMQARVNAADWGALDDDNQWS